ncbi:MAG: hypothetical protein R3186_07420 [Ruegeria sp.]|nr:hypothetical protein [Ruegeria sp.]
MSDLIAIVSGSLGMLPSATLPGIVRAGQPLKEGFLSRPMVRPPTLPDRV